VEKRHSPVNIRFGVETSDIRNLKTSDQMLKHQKWQHCYSTNFKVLGRPGRESKSKPTRTIADALTTRPRAVCKLRFAAERDKVL